jgi:hypothetical protein
MCNAALKRTNFFVSATRGFSLHFGAAPIKREVFERVGVRNGHLKMCDDLDWFNRAQKAFEPLALIPEVVLK